MTYQWYWDAGGRRGYLPFSPSLNQRLECAHESFGPKASTSFLNAGTTYVVVKTRKGWVQQRESEPGRWRAVVRRKSFLADPPPQAQTAMQPELASTGLSVARLNVLGQERVDLVTPAATVVSIAEGPARTLQLGVQGTLNINFAFIRTANFTVPRSSRSSIRVWLLIGKMEVSAAAQMAVGSPQAQRFTIDGYIVLSQICMDKATKDCPEGGWRKPARGKKNLLLASLEPPAPEPPGNTRCWTSTTEASQFITGREGPIKARVTSWEEKLADNSLQRSTIHVTGEIELATGAPPNVLSPGRYSLLADMLATPSASVNGCTAHTETVNLSGGMLRIESAVDATLKVCVDAHTVSGD